jgi:hypothetical protein
MRLAGPTTWKLSTDQPQSLLLALYVRDASDLRAQTDPEIPALEPAIPVEKAQPAIAGIASGQWTRWWQDLLEGGGFWPEGKDPSHLSRMRDDPQIQKLFYWPSRHLPPEFVGLSDTPQLRALLRLHHDAARVWIEARHLEFATTSSARERGPLESEIVRSVERTFGHTARPFELDIRVLPIKGVHAWRLTPRRALISFSLFRDAVSYGEWLRPIVEELA